MHARRLHPGGLNANRESAECVVGYGRRIPPNSGPSVRPSTAGGLLISMAEDAGALTRALQAAGVPAVEIGQVLPRTKPLIRVTS